MPTYSTFRFGAEIKRQIEERDRQAQRADFAAIAGWISAGRAACSTWAAATAACSRYSTRERDVTGYGVEIDDDGVLACVRNGVNVMQSDLERGLSGFDDASFDYVILSQTLQAMRNSESIVARNAARGARRHRHLPQFRLLAHRSQILRGRMPVSDEPALRVVRHAEHAPVHGGRLRAFLRERNCVVENRVVLAGGHAVNVLPNLLGELAIYRFRPRLEKIDRAEAGNAGRQPAEDEEQDEGARRSDRPGKARPARGGQRMSAGRPRYSR